MTFLPIASTPPSQDYPRIGRRGLVKPITTRAISRMVKGAEGIAPLPLGDCRTSRMVSDPTGHGETDSVLSVSSHPEEGTGYRDESALAS